MKFDLLLWVINVLNLKFQRAALLSEHWGDHFSTTKNKTNHHPLFLSSSSFRIPVFSPALQNLRHPACTAAWLLICLDCSLFTLFFVCSQIPFQHTHWWKEYSLSTKWIPVLSFTNLSPDIKYLHFTVWRQPKHYRPHSPSSSQETHGTLEYLQQKFCLF